MNCLGRQEANRDHGMDHSLADAQLALCKKAINAGNSQADFAYLYQVLKKGSARRRIRPIEFARAAVNRCHESQVLSCESGVPSDHFATGTIKMVNLS